MKFDRSFHPVCILLLSGMIAPCAVGVEPVDTNRPLSIKPLEAPAAPASAESDKTPVAATTDTPPRRAQNANLPPQEFLPIGPPPADAAPAAPRTSETNQDWVLNTVTALGLVIAVIILLRIVLLRAGGGGRSGPHGRFVEVLARTTIAPRTQIIFLQINQRIIVAVQTPSGINTLTCLDDPADVTWLMGRIEAARPRSISQGFRQLMHRFDRDYTTDPSDEEGGDTTEHYVDRTREGLSGLMSQIRTLKGRSA